MLCTLQIKASWIQWHKSRYGNMLRYSLSVPRQTKMDCGTICSWTHQLLHSFDSTFVLESLHCLSHHTHVQFMSCHIPTPFSCNMFDISGWLPPLSWESGPAISGIWLSASWWGYSGKLLAGSLQVGDRNVVFAYVLKDDCGHVIRLKGWVELCGALREGWNAEKIFKTYIVQNAITVYY